MRHFHVCDRPLLERDGVMQNVVAVDNDDGLCVVCSRIANIYLAPVLDILNFLDHIINRLHRPLIAFTVAIS